MYIQFVEMADLPSAFESKSCLMRLIKFLGVYLIEFNKSVSNVDILDFEAHCQNACGSASVRDVTSDVTPTGVWSCTSNNSRA